MLFQIKVRFFNTIKVYLKDCLSLKLKVFANVLMITLLKWGVSAHVSICEHRKQVLSIVLLVRKRLKPFIYKGFGHHIVQQLSNPVPFSRNARSHRLKHYFLIC